MLLLSVCAVQAKAFCLDGHFSEVGIEEVFWESVANDQMMVDDENVEVDQHEDVV